MAHVDYGIDEVAVHLACLDVVDEAFVDFEEVYRKFEELRYRRVPRPEIVERNLHADILEHLYVPDRRLERIGERIFRYLDFEAFRRESRLLDKRLDPIGKIGAGDVLCGNVEREDELFFRFVEDGLEFHHAAPENVMVDKDDEVRFFRRRDENSGADGRSVGFPASDERLEPAEPLRVRLELRLVDEVEPIVFERVLDELFRLELVRHLVFHRLVVENHAVVRLFRVADCVGGIAQKLDAVARIVREFRHAADKGDLAALLEAVFRDFAVEHVDFLRRLVDYFVQR